MRQFSGEKRRRHIDEREKEEEGRSLESKRWGEVEREEEEQERGELRLREGKKWEG